MAEEELRPNYYFSQEAMDKYRDLFKVDRVWEVLPKIKGYIDKNLEGITKLEVGEGTIVDNKAIIEGAVKIGSNCTIRGGSYIQGPAIIGNNTEIRPGAYIRGYVLIGDDCVIRSELKNAIMMDGSHAAHLSYIGDSIVGERSNLGALTVLSNLSLSEKPVQIKYNEKKIDSGLKKFGAVLGDDVHTGSGTLTNPGTIVGKNTNIYPNVVAHGFYPINSIVKLRQQQEVITKT